MEEFEWQRWHTCVDVETTLFPLSLFLYLYEFSRVQLHVIRSFLQISIVQSIILIKFGEWEMQPGTPENHTTHNGPWKTFYSQLTVKDSLSKVLGICWVFTTFFFLGFFFPTRVTRVTLMCLTRCAWLDKSTSARPSATIQMTTNCAVDKFDMVPFFTASTRWQ